MWFKNIHVFQLLEPFKWQENELNEALMEDQTRHCGQLEKTTYGWTPPLGPGAELLVHTIDGCYMLAARKEEKLLPTSIIRDHMTERMVELEDEQGRKLSAREKRALKDEVTMQLLPKALAKSDTTYGYIDARNGWLIVDTASHNKAEEFTVLLRKTLGELKILPPVTEKSTSRTMTQWVVNDSVPSDFTVDNYCEMRDPRSVSTVIRCVNQDLHTDEVIGHITAGKEITQLSMTWLDRVSFVVDDELTIKRISFTDLVQEEAKEIYAETPAEQFDADFSIFSAEFASFLPCLFNAFGGLSEEEAAASASVKMMEAMAS